MKNKVIGILGAAAIIGAAAVVVPTYDFYKRTYTSYFVPSNLESCVLWLDASNVNVNDGDKVDSLFDYSIRNNVSIQSDTSKQPVLIEDEINCNPVLRFDGIDDKLTLGYDISLLTPNVSVFVVGRAFQKNGFNTFISNCNDNTHPEGWQLGLYGNETSSMFYTGKANYDYYSSDIAQIPSNFAIYEFINTNPTSISAINGVNGASFNANIAYPHRYNESYFSIGSCPLLDGDVNFLNGDIAEIIVFNEALSTTNRDKVYNYLNKKYKISNNIVPTMTSMNSPEGVVTESGHYSNFDAHNCFDRNVQSTWYKDNLSFPEYIGYEFTENKTVNSYRLYCGFHSTHPEQMPKDWTLQASNTGLFNGEEVVLDTQVNQDNWNTYEGRTYYFTNNANYKYYRFVFTAVNGSTSSIDVGEIELFSK